MKDEVRGGIMTKDGVYRLARERDEEFEQQADDQVRCDAGADVLRRPRRRGKPSARRWAGEKVTSSRPDARSVDFRHGRQASLRRPFS